MIEIANCSVGDVLTNCSNSLLLMVNSSLSSDNDTTDCVNEYCETDEEYIDRIEAYIFPSVYELILVRSKKLIYT